MMLHRPTLRSLMLASVLSPTSNRSISDFTITPPKSFAVAQDFRYPLDVRRHFSYKRG